MASFTSIYMSAIRRRRRIWADEDTRVSPSYFPASAPVIAHRAGSCFPAPRSSALFPLQEFKPLGVYVTVVPVVRQNVVIAEPLLLSAGTPDRIRTCLN